MQKTRQATRKAIASVSATAKTMTKSRPVPAGNAADREFVIPCLFPVPRQLVFKVRTVPTQTMQRWGPRILTTLQLDRRDIKLLKPAYAAGGKLGKTTTQIKVGEP